ncbi:MAG: 1,4-alpha-glucan branching protein domain-containing protein, partial [Candidatus Competibacteraceae bacterium]|nr:1,4-alpha-glucan branching protein domain-containing protein [Candidatus Competibacteraceae bacterium]
MPNGYLAFVLHAHLPYVRHPEYDRFLEERWLFEAMTESYIPLIQVFDRLLSEHTPCRLTLSISPSLLAMLEDPLLMERYEAHLHQSIELSERELARTQSEPHFHQLAEFYHRFFVAGLDTFVNRCQRRLATAFRYFHEQGVIYLITTSATHGLLPLLAGQPKAVDAQIIIGLDYFESVFGFRPDGLWLPECGYYPGLDTILAKQNIRFFFLESHGIEHASITPCNGVYTPLYTPSGVAAFGRDRGSTKQVWSAQEGFPGHPDYREFYRDIGHHLDFDYIRPYLADGIRVDTGIKYHRITGPTTRKELYRPATARKRAEFHAEDFLNQRIADIEYLSSVMEDAPLVIAPFDAELFGHWWFEGPQWLDFVIRKSGDNQASLALTVPGDYLDRHPLHQTGTPCTSTWGDKGYFEAWLNGKTDWIYPKLHVCSMRMEALANNQGRGEVSELNRRALNQCVRELLLAQSSDWPFIINNGTATEYAERRVNDHVARFHYLADA